MSGTVLTGAATGDTGNETQRLSSAVLRCINETFRTAYLIFHNSTRSVYSYSYIPMSEIGSVLITKKPMEARNACMAVHCFQIYARFPQLH